MTVFGKDVERVGHNGTLAWNRLQKGGRDWTDWMAVGEALVAGREIAMRGAQTNEPQGRGYNQLFGQYLTHFRLQDIDKGDRSRLFEVMANRGEIEEWRASLPLTNRLKLNHPQSVLRAWKKATQVTTPKKPKKKALSVVEESERLSKENADLRAQLEEAEAARETPKLTTRAGAREQYLTHLKNLSTSDTKAEIEVLAEELGFTVKLEKVE